MSLRDQSNGRGFTHEPPTGGTPEWYTPPYIFAFLDARFDLDPCAPALPAADWLPVDRRYSRPQDGLSLPWEGQVWLNPPYASETARWVGKLAQHGNGIALVFTRCCTPWWQDAAAAASAVCFVRGRVEFVPGDPEFRRRSRSGAPSCLLGFGDECARILRNAELGVVLDGGVDHRLRLADVA